MREFAYSFLKIFLSCMLGAVLFLATTVYIAFLLILDRLFPLSAYLLSGGWQKFLCWLMMICLNIPLHYILILYLITFYKKKRFKISKKAVYRLVAVCAICIISALLLISSLLNSYKEVALVRTSGIAVPETFKKIVLKVQKSGDRFYTWWYQSNGLFSNQIKAITINNVKIKLMLSKDTSYHISLIRCANGNSQSEAAENARAINYKLAQQDSLIALDPGFVLSPGQKLRNQGVLVVVEIPVNKAIVIDKSVYQTFYWIHHNFSGKPDLVEQETENNADSPYEGNVIYVMKPNGLQLLK